MVPETFGEWKFFRPEFEDSKFNRITKLSENLENKSIWQKLQYRNPDNVSKNMVPSKTKTILMPSAETIESFSLNYEKFFQYDEKDQKILFIDSELILLHKTFQKYSPELSTDFHIPENHLLVELPSR